MLTTRTAILIHKQEELYAYLKTSIQTSVQIMLMTSATTKASDKNMDYAPGAQKHNHSHIVGVVYRVM